MPFVPPREHLLLGKPVGLNRAVVHEAVLFIPYDSDVIVDGILDDNLGLRTRRREDQILGRTRYATTDSIHRERRMS